SRTVPFLSKVTGVPMVTLATRVAMGEELAAMDGGKWAGHPDDLWPVQPLFAVKGPVFSMSKLVGAELALGPEMKSTGEVMGVDASFGKAFAKSQAAAYGSLPTKGTVFVSVANRDKRAIVFPVKRLADLGFDVLATTGTAEVLRRNGIPAEVVNKYSEGSVEGHGGATIVDKILAGEVHLVINTPYGNPGPRADGYEIRTAAVARDIPCITTIQGAAAAVHGIEATIRGDIGVQPLQALQAALRAGQPVQGCGQG
ncbi:MAG: carbamoyl-phosphate synthase large subunit, partial [Sciscionella sp.]